MQLTPETTVNTEVLQELRGVAGQVRDLRTILMGSGEPGEETEYGRIKMLERTAEFHEKRLVRLERVVWLYTGGGFVIGFLLHYMAH